jgi:integrase
MAKIYASAPGLLNAGGSADARRAKASTLGRRVAAIRYAQKLASLPTPTDAEAVKATHTSRAGHCSRWSKAARTPWPANGTALFLLLGFAGAFRRSELVALDVEHIEETANGLRVLIASSKTDFVLSARRRLSRAPPI